MCRTDIYARSSGFSCTQYLCTCSTYAALRLGLSCRPAASERPTHTGRKSATDIDYKLSRPLRPDNLDLGTPYRSGGRYPVALLERGKLPWLCDLETVVFGAVEYPDPGIPYLLDEYLLTTWCWYAILLTVASPRDNKVAMVLNVI